MEKNTIEELIAFFPQTESSTFESIFKRFKEIFNDYSDKSRDHIETPGDIQELRTLINDHVLTFSSKKLITATKLEKVLAVGNLLNQFWAYYVVSGEECDKLPGAFEMVRTQYPKLWRTFMVWAWG
jgi:hypothetical protein